ncbi:MAG: methyltransferase domain-containing protein [Deltaproteobacteria bacterium]|nr:methyltransferase domain-containing protein [Deltaproteobacteria bacterium]
MDENHFDHISTDMLIAKIKQEAVSKSNQTTPVFAGTASIGPLPVITQDDNFQSQDIYHVSDLTRYHDEEFIRNIYRGILKRDPDIEGFSLYLNKLRKGELTKLKLIKILASSAEGKQAATKIRGLSPKLALNLILRIPILGYFVNLFLALLRLPKLRHYEQNFERFVFATINNNNHQINASLEDVRRAVNDKPDELYLSETLDRQLLAVQSEWRNELADVRRAVNDKPDELYLSETLDRQLLAVQSEWRNELANKVNAVQEQLYNRLTETMAEYHGQFHQHVSERDASLQEQVGGKIGEVTEKIYKQINGLKYSIVDQQRRLQILFEDIRKRLPAPAPLVETQLACIIREQDHFLDSFYVSFEDEFRGLKHDIKAGLEIYLPYIADVSHKFGKDTHTIVDLGCGRGEWLELLMDHQYLPLGVDQNRIFISLCKNSGLSVHENDIFDFLMETKDNTLIAVSAFHVIEHFSQRHVVDLLDETLRVLKHGGLVLLELPNIQNMLVSSVDFYLDPTHINHIHPKTLLFTAEQRGFCDVAGFFVERSEQGSRLINIRDYAFEDINKYIDVPRDFVLIAYKD